MNNYVLAKEKNNGQLTFIGYKKMSGYKVSPKSNIDYPGIEINSIVIIKPSFIEKVLKRKNKIKLNYYLNYIIDEADDDSTDVSQVLDDIERYKGIIEYKYRKFLSDKYINLLNRKISLVEKKLKAKLVYLELTKQNDDILEQTRGKSR